MYSDYVTGALLSTAIETPTFVRVYTIVRYTSPTTTALPYVLVLLYVHSLFILLLLAL
jgi:hypothetical protein